ncbi:ethanolamine kinase [Drosophila willistoni]|uniref:ethanolamine kinase n=1 Tax=Drosophila willistoni TaxID=7260 RepID=UPI00017D8DBF|nr:ethanolamine kinase [Drosophila willistoni]XP_023035341.1 ethanolamine kinase [Drosophila willistoni]XP_046867184.1 ethanolamine kinase [Drosophila willistoni]
MGTETKSNSYTGQISTSGGNPKVMKDSLSLVQRQQQQSHFNDISLNSSTTNTTNSIQTESERQAADAAAEPPHYHHHHHHHHPEEDKNSCDKRPKHHQLDAKEAIVPFVPIFVEESDVIQGATDILKVIRPNWDLTHVEFKKFTDGITNKLVGCFHQPSLKLNDENGDATYTGINNAHNCLPCVQSENDDENDNENDSPPLGGQRDGSPVQYSDNVVLVRVYGNKTDLLIDRKAETQNFLLLHTYGLAPSLYATFKNGLVYEYVPGNTLNTESVLCPDIWPLVARRMAEMHRVVKKKGDAKPMPMIWRKTQSFLDLVPERFSDAEKHKRVKETFLPISRLREEFNNLYKYLEALQSPIVFSHNDLLLGNVIYTKSMNAVNFIDYEYADYNFQAFDIGNHFAEMCGVDEVDYTRYPKREFQLKWLRVYLESYLQRTNILSDEVEQLYVQVNQFALAAHIFWTVWSLLQAEHSTIDFDYVGYAFLRYNEYLARKDEFLSLTASKTNE